MTALAAGVRESICEKHGFDHHIANFAGAAKLQQGLVSKSVELRLRSRPGKAFAVKGSPVTAVAAVS